MTAPTFSHKRGDTFILAATATTANNEAIDLTNVTVRAQVRTDYSNGSKLVAELIATVTNGPAGKYTLRAPGDATTNSWPVGTLEMDIEYESDSGLEGIKQIQSSQTVLINVLRDITKG